MDTREWAIVAGGFLLRSVVTYTLPHITSALESSVQLSTLVTSHASLKEGIFLYNHGMDAYDGGVVHQSPILLYLLSGVPEQWLHMVYTAVDTYITVLFIKLAHKMELKKVSPWLLGASYALNPIAIASSLAKSSLVFTNASVLSAFYAGVIGDSFFSAVWISLATCLSYSPLFLIFPLGKLVALRGNILTYAFSLLLASVALTVACFEITDSWGFIYATYGTIVNFTKVAPNMGLWWYFFTEMFDFFIPFYTMVFSLYNVAFILPFTFRLKGAFAFIMALGWLNFGKPYPELTDLPLYLTLLLSLEDYFKYISYPMVCALLFIHSIILAPIFYHLWIDLGSGNSNFFFAITLVYSLGVAATIGDFLWAYMQKEYIEEHPEDNDIPLSQI